MNTYQIRDTIGFVYFIEADSIEELFHRIDGLRLDGKRWIKCKGYPDPNRDGESPTCYVSIEHIVAIEEEYE